jgi:diguanylate cyclase (GGDEF)-like protein
MNVQPEPDTPVEASASSRVLVVDDDASILGVVAEVLEDDGYRVSTAASGEEAVELLQGDPFALVMSDIRLPGMDGIAVLEHVKIVSPRTNVIMITSHGSMESSINAIQLGAYDYLLKPFEDLSLISSAAKRATDAYNLDLDRSQLIRSLKLSNDELARMSQVFQELAIRDGLTDLFNHRHINEILDQQIEKAVKEASDLSLIFVDVDQFKIFNDTYGHQNGDLVLRELGGLMQESVRKKDIVARWGGEEFVVVAPNTNEQTAARLAEELRRSVAEHRFKRGESEHPNLITISAGVSSLTRQKTKASLIEAADAALYDAKANGRDQVYIANQHGKSIRVAS